MRGAGKQKKAIIEARELERMRLQLQDVEHNYRVQMERLRNTTATATQVFRAFGTTATTYTGANTTPILGDGMRWNTAPMPIGWAATPATIPGTGFRYRYPATLTGGYVPVTQELMGDVTFQMPTTLTGIGWGPEMFSMPGQDDHLVAAVNLMPNSWFVDEDQTLESMQIWETSLDDMPNVRIWAKFRDGTAFKKLYDAEEMLWSVGPLTYHLDPKLLAA